MSGTIGNPTGMGGWGGGIGFDSGLQNPAMWTPQQRAQMYAMQLMRSGSSQPQSSGWGAINNAMGPILGGAMMNWGGNQQGQPALGGGGLGAGGWAGPMYGGSSSF